MDRAETNIRNVMNLFYEQVFKYSFVLITHMRSASVYSLPRTHTHTHTHTTH